MTKEELLKKIYYDLKSPAACAGKSKLLQKAGNHLIMTKKELLKKLYYDLKLCHTMLKSPICSKKQRNMTQIYL